MKLFNWNREGTPQKFWDHRVGDWELRNTKTDKQIINNPMNHGNETLFAVCRVLSELIELEEKRNGGIEGFRVVYKCVKCRALLDENAIDCINCNPPPVDERG